MKIPIKERKEQVIVLHKLEHTVRQIAKELHMSGRDVSQLIREYKREEKEKREKQVIEKEKNEQKKLFLLKRSDALKLYKKGKSPLDVAIELEISAEEANAFYHEFCSLQHPPQLSQIYTELNNTNSFDQFIDLFHLIRQKNLNIKQGIEAIETTNDISLLKEERQDLSEKVQNLRKMNFFLLDENNSLRDQNAAMGKRLESTFEKISIAEKNLKDINKRVIQKEEEINKINSGEDYYKAREKAKLLVEEFLLKESNVIQLAITSLYQVVNENRQKENSSIHIPNSVYEYVVNSSDNEVNREKLNNVGEKMLDNISEILVDDIFNSSLNISKD